jgi:hypothetical protein
MKQLAPISLSLLLTVFDHQCLHGTRYRLGAKAPSLSCDSADISAIDCSGESRYLLAKATEQKLIIPDGSVNQHSWCEAWNLTKADYLHVATALPWMIYICFIEPTGRHPGHVWLVHDGDTLESHGGVGVTSRRWSAPVLMRQVSACYELLAKP